MEGSKSEAVLEYFNLKSQLLINEALNTVDDLLDDAFSFFLQEGSKLLEIEGTDRAAELTKGVAYLQNLIQSNLDQRLQMWEEYCHRFCFHVPDDISLPESNELAGDDLLNTGEVADKDLDEQLKSLRDKLTEVGEESARLGRELSALEKQSLSSSTSAGCIDEALQFCKELNTNQMLHELATVASELRAKLGNLKRRKIDKTQCDIVNGTCITGGDMLRTHRGKGIFDLKLEELEKFVDEISKS